MEKRKRTFNKELGLLRRRYVRGMSAERTALPVHTHTLRDHGFYRELLTRLLLLRLNKLLLISSGFVIISGADTIRFRRVRTKASVFSAHTNALKNILRT